MTPLDDAELVRRSLAGFAEMLTIVGHSGEGSDAVIRRPDAIGARIASMRANPWFDAVVVPAGSDPPVDDPLLPYCVWTLAPAMTGRVEDPDIATPCMALDLERPLPFEFDPVVMVTPTLTEVGLLNDRAYAAEPSLELLAADIDDDRVATYGVESEGRLVSVAMTLVLGDDLAIHYVATESDHRGQGLATRMLATVIEDAQNAGMRSATLQASPDGLSVYQRMGFQTVGLLLGFVRPTTAT